MVAYNLEDMTTIQEEITPLFQNHWDEVDLFVDLGMNPNWVVYKELQEAERLKCITVRDDDLLVGYAVWVINPSLHFADYLLGTNDLLYLKPEYRHSEISKDLLAFSESILKEAAVDVAFINMKTYATYENLAESCGYFNVESVFTKIIG
jgi:hypothetical protein